MKRFLSRYWSWLLTLLFGLCVFLFWRLRYPFALTYQEQFQLFLLDADYFAERMAEPGGFARYIAEFLVQFYNHVTTGAAVLAVLFMLIQRLTWRVMESESTGPYPLSFVPVLMLWYAMGDESVLLTYAVALVLALAAVLLIQELQIMGFVLELAGLTRLGGQAWMWLFIVVLMPVLYWLIGPMALLVALCMATWQMVVAALIIIVACILMSAHFLPYPLLRLILGIGYYRFPVTLPYILMAIPVVIWGLQWFFGLRFARELKISRPILAGVLAVVAVGGLMIIPRGFDQRKYDLIEYDYLVRVRDWKAIIAKAEKKTPDLPMSVCANNLALAMTNQLGERAFDFYQRSSEGLLPRFERNFATAQLTGEVYFHLGLVNTAQRFAFEAMEAIPNYNKSARVVKRLAETNLINGQYKVAEKYLQMLEKTIFYRPWARRTMALMGDEEAINAHSLYGWLRKVRLQDDFLFSEDEIDKICGQLFMHNQQNAMAMQYLVMAPLLDGDAQRFMAYIAYVQSKVNYNPRYVREAIAKISRTR